MADTASKRSRDSTDYSQAVLNAKKLKERLQAQLGVQGGTTKENRGPGQPKSDDVCTLKKPKKAHNLATGATSQPSVTQSDSTGFGAGADVNKSNINVIQLADNSHQVQTGGDKVDKTKSEASENGNGNKRRKVSVGDVTKEANDGPTAPSAKSKKAKRQGDSKDKQRKDDDEEDGDESR